MTKTKTFNGKRYTLDNRRFSSLRAARQWAADARSTGLLARAHKLKNGRFVIYTRKR